MIHLDEHSMGPLCKVTSALALASALTLAGCAGGASSASSPSIMLLAANDGVSGFELWKTDGSAMGTVLVKDINPGAGHSSPGGSGLFPSEFAFFNGAWFFSADDGTGPKLWKSDGTQAGTARVTAVVSSPREFTVLGNALYFSADDGVNGRELWKTDGTEARTVLVKDIAPGTVSIGGIQVPRSSSPTGLTVFNNALYFSADDGVNGRELWKSDGTVPGTVQVKNINSSGDSSPSGFTVFNNALYFWADDGMTGFELWKSDGTDNGTMRVKDINPGAGSSPNALTVLNNALLFSADDGMTGRELWRTDGTVGGTMQVKDICPGPCDGVPVLVILP